MQGGSMVHLGKIGKTLFLAVLIMSTISTVKAQKIEITPFGGYFFAGKLAVGSGDLNVKNDGNYGVALGINIQPDLGIEFTYNRLDTRLVLKEWRTGLSTDLFDMSVNYFHLGAVYTAKKIDDGILFTTFSLGATQFAPDVAQIEDPQDPNKIIRVEDDWRFSIGLGGGVKKYLSDRIGIRLQLRLLMPIYWASGGLWFGTGGAGLGIGAGTALLQADATAGIIIRL
jgi:opacity protein-like surface antigen